MGVFWKGQPAESDYLALLWFCPQFRASPKWN
jgi:hypothetical protein